MIMIIIFISYLIASPLVHATEICTGLLCDGSIQTCSIGLYCKLNGFIGECCVNSDPTTVSPTNSPINPLLYLTTTSSSSLFQTTNHKYTTRDFTIGSHSTFHPHPTHSTSQNHGCEDRVNPQTKVSDCSSKKYLCKDKLYHNFMTYQCPKTCGRCSPSNSVTSSRNCKDKTNRFTGNSDCPLRSYLCNDERYKSLMAIQCPRTCKLC